jgi:uncharacterized damage-inducible protein DinB
MQFNLGKSMEILKQTPETFISLLSGLSEDWTYSNEGPDTWSPYDVMGHLIHGEETDWIQRLNIILGDTEDKTFEPFDRFTQFENSKGKALCDLLEEFAGLRKKNLDYLSSLDLSEDQFGLKGMHPELGEVTLGQLLATQVTHDLGHIAQITRVMAKQYKEDVGPWEAYIPVFNR